MIIGSGSASFEIMRYLVQRLPVMITPTWVSTRCQPIAIENVLGYLVGVLSSADTTGEVFDIGGREILTYRDIMRIMAEELDLPPRLQMFAQPGSHLSQAAQIDDATDAGITGSGGERQRQCEIVLGVRAVARHHRMDEIVGDVAAGEVSSE